MSASSNAGDETIFRLFDMDTEEVSLVDRAANKRKFIVHKREGANVSTEVRKNPDGSYSTSPPKPAGETPAAAGEAAPKGAQPSASVAKAGALSLTEPAKQSVLTVLGSLVAMLEGMKTAADGATVVEGEADMVIDPLAAGLMEVAETAEDLVMALVGEVPEVTGGAEPAPEPTDEVAEPPMGKRLELALAKRLLDNAGVERIVAGVVAKVGRKMSARRAEKLRTAIKLLGNVWREIKPVTEKLISGNVTKADISPPAPPAPPAAPPVEDTRLATLEKKLKELTDVCASQRDELLTLRKGGLPNGLVPDNGVPSGEHVWSTDIAADIRKQRGGK